MNAELAVIPDLLRRFLPATLCADIAVDNIAVTLHTNDPGIVSAMQHAHPYGDVLSTRRLLIKILRDDAAPSCGSPLTFLSLWPLGTLSLGAGTVLAIDCERGEIVGFVANPVPANRVVNELLPMLFEFLDEHRAAVERY